MDCMSTCIHHDHASAAEMKCEDVCLCLLLGGGGIQRMLEGGGDEGGGDGKGDAWCLLLMSRAMLFYRMWVMCDVMCVM